MLYHIDSLNVLIETTKWILTKEKIDKQKTGQSSATPFMKASHDKSKKSEKGVSFGTLETKDTIDKHSSSIVKLTSLVNKLDMKLDRQESQYRPMVYQNRNRGCPQRQSNYKYRNRSYNQDRNQPYRGRGNFIGPTIGIEVDQGIIGIETITWEAIMPKIIGEITIDTTMVIKGTGIEIGV